MECDRAGNSELGEKWQAVIDAANGKAITAELVQRIVDGEPEKQTKRMQIDIEIYQQLEAKAKLAGITVQELLKKLVEGHIPDENDSESIPEEEEDTESKEQKLVKWEEDLIELVKEADEEYKIIGTVGAENREMDDS